MKKTMKVKRVYRDCREWEEVKFNMWGEVDNRKEWLKRAIEFTGNAEIYGSFMKRVVYEWPVSCENALTDLSMNRKAWVGHAAVALAIKCPEDIVRQAWGHLTDEQRLLANQEAERSIQEWEHNYLQHS